MWAQYTISDGVIQATNSQKVDDAVLAALGRAQIQLPEDGNTYTKVDMTQNPPVFS